MDFLFPPTKKLTWREKCMNNVYTHVIQRRTKMFSINCYCACESLGLIFKTLSVDFWSCYNSNPQNWTHPNSLGLLLPLRWTWTEVIGHWLCWGGFQLLTSWMRSTDQEDSLPHQDHRRLWPKSLKVVHLLCANFVKIGTFINGW